VYLIYIITKSVGISEPKLSSHGLLSSPHEQQSIYRNCRDFMARRCGEDNPSLLGYHSTDYL